MIDHPLMKDCLSYHPGGLIYLATPYTEWARKGEGQWAHDLALSWVAKIAAKGMTAVSPVMHGHAMCEAYPDQFSPFDHALWMEWGSRILRACNSVVVPPIDGRSTSRGIAEEVREAIRQVKPVIWLPGL